MSDPNSYFQRMLSGQVAPPPVATLLGAKVQSVDLDVGSLVVHYHAPSSFHNPAGNVQGGMLGAMLDDLCASLVDATLNVDQAVVTLSLNVSYLRSAHMGEIVGTAHFLRRGRDVCHVNGVLIQDGKEVATAVAICKIMKH